MRGRFSFRAGLVMGGLILLALPAQAKPKFTAKELNELDKLGAFPPDFKAVVHEYVRVVQALTDTQAAEKKLRDQLPGLEGKAATEQGKVDDLQKVLADYDHTDESDFVVLQNKMNDATAKPEDQLSAAQVFVWSYPSSPHLPQALTYLQKVQKEIADQIQAEKDAEAAKAAAWAKLLQRVHDKDLSINEWKDFLNNMSQDDVTNYLGTPSQEEGYYWIYHGGWAVDAGKTTKGGLQLNFNGGRVVGVTETVEEAPSAAPASGPGTD